MQRGRIVEHGTVGDIFDNPQHPYTASLLESIPSGIAGDARVSRLQPRRIISREKIA
jgi:peptide/nickel transport system ATP-binding protein